MEPSEPREGEAEKEAEKMSDTSKSVGRNSGVVGSTVSGGVESCLLIRHWDGSRFRVVATYVVECGIKPHTKYRLDESGKFVTVNQLDAPAPEVSN